MFRKRPLLTASLLLLLCGLLFASCLEVTGPLALLGLYLRYDTLFLPCFLAAVFYLLSRLPLNLAQLGPVFLSVSLCGLVLAGIWQEQVSDLSTLAGLYPHGDARSYLNGALNLLHGQELHPKASRRPLAIVLWAGLFKLGGMDLKITLALMVFFSALALGFLSRAVYKSYGWQVGYIIFLSLFLFYRRFVGTFLTEHLGLALGCLACMLLMQAVHEHRRSLVYGGLLLLTLALNARAGAFFLLPCLALWAGWHWRGQQRFSFKVCSLATIALLSGFAVNSLALHSLGQREASQGNFSYTLYGLVHGGNWTLVLEEHPELLVLPEIERHQAIYDLAWHKISSEPSSVLRGAARAYRAFFGSIQGPYSFVFFALQHNMLTQTAGEAPGIKEINPASIVKAVQEQPLKYGQIFAAFAWYGFFFLLAGIGFFFIIKNKHPLQGLILCAWVGILASIPFIPPWDVDLMRVHAASLPFLLFPPAFGCAALFGTFGKQESLIFQQRDRREGGLILILPLGMTALFLLLSFLFAANKKTEAPAENFCTQGEPWLLQFVPGSPLAVTPESAFKKNLGILALTDTHRSRPLLRFTPDQTLTLGYDRLSGTLRYLVVDTVEQSDWLPVCAHSVVDTDWNGWWVLDTTDSSVRKF
jgi:hypothetical protein